MKSSFVQWLSEQQLRHDIVGDLARHVAQWERNGFTPVDLEDIVNMLLEKDLNVAFAHQAMHEFAKIHGLLDVEPRTGDIVIPAYKLVDELEVLKEKLANAVRDEQYERAAKLRDEINELKKEIEDE